MVYRLCNPLAALILNKNPIPSSHTDNASKTEFLPLPNETSPSDMAEEAVPDTIDQDLVKWALLHQKNGKTVRPDGLPAEVIKNQVGFSKSLLCLSKEPNNSHMELLPHYQTTKQVTLESHLITEEYHFSQYHIRPFVQF